MVNVQNKDANATVTATAISENNDSANDIVAPLPLPCPDPEPELDPPPGVPGVVPSSVPLKNVSVSQYSMKIFLALAHLVKTRT